MAAGSASGADLPVVETAAQIKTPDGTCDAMFIHPTAGSHPAVLIWPDAFGLRPSMRDIGKRIAAEGYAVLVPNPVLPRREGAGDRGSRVVQLREPDRHGEAAAVDGVDQRGRRSGERMRRRLSPGSIRSRR
jgi:dienelactone hydrolase